MKRIRFVLGWLNCWDRSWNARAAWVAAHFGQYRCPCGNCKGIRVPARVSHIDVEALEAADRARRIV